MIKSLRGTFLLASLLGLVGCGGRGVETKQELADAIAFLSVPSTAARPAGVSVDAGGGGLPEPSITFRGANGGEATLSINPIGAALGLAAKGLLFDVRYAGFTEDGFHRMDGRLSVLANFNYVAAPENPYADLRLSLVGKANLSGPYSDEVRLNVAVTTRFHDLNFREDSIDLHLNGTVEAHGETFTFDHEDLEVLWAQAQQPQP